MSGGGQVVVWLALYTSTLACNDIPKSEGGGGPVPPHPSSTGPVLFPPFSKVNHSEAICSLILVLFDYLETWA